MHPDSFHRLAKALVDSGEAETILEAMDMFGQYGVRISIAKNLQSDEASQVVALTAINAATRSFGGNVMVEADDCELSVRGFQGQSLFSFLEWAGVVNPFTNQAATWPTISIGGPKRREAAINVWADGWSFGLGERRGERALFVPACVAAGGLAVSEAFSVLRLDNPYAGRRNLSLSLWDPRAKMPTPGPQKIPMQQAMWLVGLGHLGQAYAWALGFMERGELPLLLQDVDSVTRSTLSTSMLSIEADIGQKKTRVVARWLEARGYNTALVERRFDEAQRVAASESTTALFGVDNPATRRVMEGCGFGLVIDAGLGSGFRDFRAIRLRTFPGPSAAARIWAAPADSGSEALAPAYQKLLEEGADRCGVTTLATRAVGAPFVGCVAAAYVLAERVRRQMGGERLGFVDFSLRDPQMMEVG